MAPRLKKTTSKGKRSVRDKYLQKTYGISLQDYYRLAAVYKGGCWVCRKPPKPGKNLAVDHDHALAKTGAVRASVRGVLCWYCNKKVIGRRRKENAGILLEAYYYLVEGRAQQILGG